MIADFFFSAIAAITAIVAIIWKAGLIYRNNHPPFLLNCYLYALQTYRTHSPKLRLLLVYLNENLLRSTKFSRASLNGARWCWTRRKSPIKIIWRILVHPEHNPLSNEHHTKHIKQINKKIKNAFYLRVNVFSTKELIGNTLAFYFIYLFLFIYFLRGEGLAVLTAKAVHLFVGYFKRLSIDPSPGIEPANHRSAVMRPNGWASPAKLVTNK